MTAQKLSEQAEESRKREYGDYDPVWDEFAPKKEPQDQKRTISAETKSRCVMRASRD